MPRQAYMDGIIRPRWWRTRQRQRANAGLPWRDTPEGELARIFRPRRLQAAGEMSMACQWEPAAHEQLMEALGGPNGPAILHVNDGQGNEIMLEGTVKLTGVEQTELSEGVHEVTYSFEVVPDVQRSVHQD